MPAVHEMGDPLVQSAVPIYLLKYKNCKNLTNFTVIVIKKKKGRQLKVQNKY